MNKKHIVVIGGGFAGTNFVKYLSNVKAYDVTLVDKNNYNYFPPLLYQVSSGFLEPSNISYPFRKMLQKKKNIRFWMGELLEINHSENEVILTSGTLKYDYLILCTGTVTNFFGMKNVERDAMPMKTVNDALQLRNYLLMQLENASQCSSIEEKTQQLNIVIAGAGPTGVEVAGILAEMKKNIFSKDYPELSGKGIHAGIYLIDGGANVLSPMSAKSQKNTYKALSGLGVNVILNARVKDYNDRKVYYQINGQEEQYIPTNTLIWAAGVSSQTLNGLPKEVYGRGNRIKVDAYNKVEGIDNIYALGDTCIQISDTAFPGGHPQVAQVALQQGKRLAQNFRRLLRQLEQRPFIYTDKGSMAIIGRNKAVADIPQFKMHFSGFVAWFMWAFIHVISLITFRNKVTTMYNWVISYFTKDQALRMIIRPDERTKRVVNIHKEEMVER